MSEREALLRAVLLNPACDTARLVYADWLTENGRADRADYIRWQLQGRFTHPFPRVSWRRWFAPWWSGATCRRHLMMDDGPTLLLMKVRHASAGYEGWNQARVTRGFVSRVELPCEAFLTHAEAIFRAHPVTEVRLTDKEPPGNPVDMHTDEMDGVYWQTEALLERLRSRLNLPYPAESRHIPVAIFALLKEPRGQRPLNLNREYDTAGNAHADLSGACVAFGRNLAGLPPLLEPAMEAA